MVAAHRLFPLVLLAALAQAQSVRVRLADRGVVPVPMEDYVAWVLAGEAGGMKSPEALKAMAVVARTYARSNLRRHAAEGFDFCETTHCQNARAGAIPARIRAAVDGTESIVLWSHGRPAQVFYSGHCAGRTAAASELWPAARRPYLPSQEDTFCLSAGRQAWSAKLPLADLARALGLAHLHSLHVSDRTPSGRVRTLASDAGPLSAERLHLQLGRLKGWNFLRSLVYEVHTEGPVAVFSGSGAGHGVGLCQTGADERGKAGHTWQAILAFYFPGLRAGVAAQDIPWQIRRGERVEAWVTNAAGDERLLPAADRALAQALKLLNLPLDATPQLRAYPTVAVFRDATGESGRLAAVTRGRVVHLQPVARHPQFDRLLLHEMVHVVLGLNALRPIPAWLDEGLAEHLSGGGAHENDRARVAALIRQQGLPAVVRLALGR